MSGRVEVGNDAAGDSAAGLAVPVGVVKTRHSLVLGGVVKKTGGLANDCFSICPNQFYRAGSNRFGTFGFVAQHENRLPERGTFLLHAAGVCDEEISSTHEVDERQIVDRLDQQDVRLAAE